MINEKVGGRLDLALGAGAFWDAMVAMGFPRLTPGEAVTAVEEGIDVIRALWSIDGSGPLRYDGIHHRLAGAKRGPAPAPDGPIGLGAGGPRMLRRVGRKADGWLPSWGRIDAAGLARGNEIIDDAAATVGRDPRDVRRLLNIFGSPEGIGPGPFEGPPARWVESLTSLALENGVSTFIVGGDDATSCAASPPRSRRQCGCRSARPAGPDPTPVPPSPVSRSRPARRREPAVGQTLRPERASGRPSLTPTRRVDVRHRRRPRTPQSRPR
jgi:hypothetical protein